METFDRVKLLIGEEKYQKLSCCHVAVFGIGGVGGITAEALVRSGIGEITVIDNDVVSKSNINRQIVALTSTVGELKTEAIKNRLLDINPNLKFNAFNMFYLPENSKEIDFSSFDYVVDAVDTITAKLLIIDSAYKNNVPVISCMGTGGKLDPSKIEVSVIEKTSVCPLSRVMRRELKQRNIVGVKVVYSKEENPVKPNEKASSGKSVQPSMMIVPSVAGLMIAGEVIKDLINR